MTSACLEDKFRSLLLSRGWRPTEEETLPRMEGQECFLRRATDPNGQAFIFRFPKNKGTSHLVERETCLLQRNVFAAFSVPAPVWEEDVMIYPRLSGIPAITTTPEGEPLWQVNGTKPNFVHSLARALAEIHHKRDFHSPPLPGLSLDSARSPHQAFLDKLRYVENRDGCSPSDLQKWKTWADETAWPPALTPIHGDMHAGNILINEQGHVTGLLDWTRSTWGDPAQDFIFHYLGFGEQGLNQLMEAYALAGGPLYPGMKEHIKGLWRAYTLWQAFFHCQEKESD